MNNVIALTDKNGKLTEEYTYTPYGNPMSREPSAMSQYLFTGRRYDPESGLYYFRHRYYDSQLGRFISAEPKPHVFLTNLYTYAMNNPINLKDPTGLCGGDPGLFPFPDSQSSRLGVFKYQTQINKNFEIYKFYPASLSLPLNLPYIPGYFYNNFEDPWWFWFATKLVLEEILFHELIEREIEILQYEKAMRMIA